jgi:hypothetical protein
MKTIHCLTYDPALFPDDPPSDLAEQLRNERRTPFRDMSPEAIEVFRKVWDRAVDGRPWPPRGDSVLMGFPR